MKPFILPLTIIALLLGLGAVLWVYGPTPSSSRPQPNAPTTPVNLGGAFALTDHHGQPRTEQDFKGRYMLVYFGYSFCPDICPSDMLAMSQALDQLGNSRKEVAALFITVDPERDTVAHLARVMENFHPDMLALTGTAEEVETAKRAYKVYSAKARPDGTVADYLVDHSTFIYLMNRDGKYITHFAHGTPAGELVERINRELAAEFRPPAETPRQRQTTEGGNDGN